MANYRRYAVYYAPPRESTLQRFGDAWLGWDAGAGVAPPPPQVGPLSRPRDEITARPRRYGFHGTLKAPFTLAPDAKPDALGAAVAELARGMLPFGMRLKLSTLGSFLALVPEAPVPALQALAAACVTGLDGFRAEMTPEERARRGEGLSPAEARMLGRWGYPYVLETFRFHMTLTGSLEVRALRETEAALRPALQPMLRDEVPVLDLCLFGEEEDGRFRIVERHKLGP